LMLGEWSGEGGGRDRDRFLREKVHEIEDIYQALILGSFFEPVGLARTYKDPVYLKPGASVGGQMDHQQQGSGTT